MNHVHGQHIWDPQKNLEMIFEVIHVYQTQETVFHRDIQTPRRELKIQHA